MDCISVVTCPIYLQMLTSLWCQHNQQMKYIINEYVHSYLRTNYIPLVIISHYLWLNYNIVIIGMNNNVMQLEYWKEMRCIKFICEYGVEKKLKKKLKRHFFMSLLTMGQINSSLELSKGQLMKPKLSYLN